MYKTKLSAICVNLTINSGSGIFICGIDGRKLCKEPGSRPETRETKAEEQYPVCNGRFKERMCITSRFFTGIMSDGK